MVMATNDELEKSGMSEEERAGLWQFHFLIECALKRNPGNTTLLLLKAAFK